MQRTLVVFLQLLLPLHFACMGRASCFDRMHTHLLIKDDVSNDKQYA